MGKALRRAVNIEAKRQTLNKVIDAGGEFAIAARATKKALANTWMRRHPNTGTMHKPGNLNDSTLTLSRSRSHLVTTI